MDRSDHYVESERLAVIAVEALESNRPDRFEVATLYCQAALVHATLAGAGPGVEADVRERAVEVRRAATTTDDPHVQGRNDQLTIVKCRCSAFVGEHRRRPACWPVTSDGPGHL